MTEPELDPVLKKFLEDSEDPVLERGEPAEEMMEETKEEEVTNPKLAGMWPEADGVLSIAAIQSAFVNSQPRDPSQYLFTRNLIQAQEETGATRRRQGTSDEDGPEETRGMPDALYALYFDWEMQKKAQGGSYRHSEPFKLRVCGLQGKSDFDEETSTWIGKKKGKLACRLKTILRQGGQPLYYLEKDGRPLVRERP